MELREVLALLGYVQRIAVALEEIAAKLPAAGSLEFETPQGELGVVTSAGATTLADMERLHRSLGEVLSNVA